MIYDILAYLNSDDLYNTNTLKIAAEYLSKKSVDWIIKESKKVMGIVKNRYGEEVFKDSIRKAMRGLLLK